MSKFHQTYRRPPPRPFVSDSLDAYLGKYWCVCFGHSKTAHDNMLMRRYADWYATRMRFVLLDRHPHGAQLRRELAARAGSGKLPVLFVKKKCIGDIEAVGRLDVAAKLKDVLHFGFEWADLGGNGGGAPAPSGVLPTKYADESMFRGIYRGAPVEAPVTRLPQFAPASKEGYDD
jgi:hypothetical protein